MEYFWCPWVLENPATWLPKDQPLMQGLPYTDVTYCRYGYSYKEKMRKWHTLGSAWQPRAPCCKATPCPAYEAEGVHAMSAQRGPTKIKVGVRSWDHCTLEQLYSMLPASATRLHLQHSSAAHFVYNRNVCTEAPKDSAALQSEA